MLQVRMLYMPREAGYNAGPEWCCEARITNSTTLKRLERHLSLT